MMNAPADNPQERVWLWLGLAGLLLVLVAWRVLAIGSGGQLLRADKPSVDQATDARRVIRAAPLDGRGYRMLAQQAELHGETQRATILYSVAAARGPRDLPSLGWLTRHALAEGDHARALATIDQMLRVQPELAPKLHPVLIALSEESQAQAAVAEVLLQSPPWREFFTPRLIAKSRDSAAIFGLIERLRLSPPGLSDEEMAAWINRLAHDRQWAPAYLIWVQSLPVEARQRIGNVYNGGFETEPGNFGFDWRFGKVPGARIAREQVTGAAGTMALGVAFENRRVPFRHVQQLLALAPGSYRLRGRVRLDDLQTERGVVWTLTCAEDGRAIAETEPMAGRHDWKSFELGFEIPAEGCGGQWLTLRVPARIPAEQLISGDAWFDDLQIRAIAP